jgi:hypothetical protein
MVIFSGPTRTSPHHYAFTKGWLGDQRYQEAARNLAPETSVRIIEPGTRIEL